MSRIAIKGPEAILGKLRPLWDRMMGDGDFADQAGVMAHRLPIFEHVWALPIDLSDEAVLPMRYLDLALVTVSLLNQCDDCVAHHTPKLQVQGVSEAGARALLHYQDQFELDDVDKLVVEYVIAVTNAWNRTRDQIFDRLKARFSEPQIVELTWRIALCGAFNRFDDVLQVAVHDGLPVPAA